MNLTLRKNVLTDGSETFDLLIDDGKNVAEINLVVPHEDRATSLAYQFQSLLNFATGAVDSIPLGFTLESAAEEKTKNKAYTVLFHDHNDDVIECDEVVIYAQDYEEAVGLALCEVERVAGAVDFTLVEK